MNGTIQSIASPQHASSAVQRFAQAYYEAHTNEGVSAMADYVNQNDSDIASDLTTTDNELLFSNALKLREKLWEAAKKADAINAERNRQ